MSKLYPKPYKAFRGGIKVKVDLSNYETKTDLKNVTHFELHMMKLYMMN